ncbi:MAG: RecQ family ATP-dependent DNA helicase, partial [Saprospiraceae bacterium]|nr:RecQ family ATP-dependent DNA helicase [Saprospiraceae bacterium]
FRVFQKSFDRSNLIYAVRYSERKHEKLVEILQNVPGSAVVYVRNRRGTKEIASYLRQHQIAADFYHGGLHLEERSKKQDLWINGQIRVIVATNAFGMGIDKPDVRSVIHINLPDSLEAYFQEAGRAGRDSQKAYAVLLYHKQDRLSLEKQFEMSFPELSVVSKVYRALGSFFQLAVGAGVNQSYDFDLVTFCERFDFQAVPTYNALRILEKEGLILLTEAVFNPARLKILLSKDALYDYQLKHPSLDRVLKVILRTYQGAFSQYIHLKEGKLANFLGITTAELIRSLNLMKHDRVIDYQMQKDQPQLIFLQDRIDADHLTLDVQQYHFLKNRHLERMTAALRYAEEPICRSQQLLTYFGESEAEACGQCDICLSRKHTSLSEKDAERFREKIKQVLLREPLTVAELLSSFGGRQRPMVIQALTYLLEEAIVIQKDNCLYWHGK